MVVHDVRWRKRMRLSVGRSALLTALLLAIVFAIFSQFHLLQEAVIPSSSSSFTTSSPRTTRAAVAKDANETIASSNTTTHTTVEHEEETEPPVNDTEPISFKDYVHMLARVWKRRPFEEWCHHNSNQQQQQQQNQNETTTKPPIPTGIIFIKVPKSASSTITGSLLRLARTNYTSHHDNGNMMLRRDETSISSNSKENMNCPVHWEHGTLRELFPQLQLQKRSIQEKEELSSSPSSPVVPFFLLTTIRDPGDRALSSVYFHRVSFHQHKAPSDQGARDKFILPALDTSRSNFIMNYTTPNGMLTTAAPVNYRLPTEKRKEQEQAEASLDMLVAASHVFNILDTYDFLVVAERLEESMIVLSYLTNVPLTRLLTLSSKQRGSWYFVKTKGGENNNGGGSRSGYCINLEAPVRSKQISKFLDSPSWRHRHRGDRLLHAVANESLQRTIDKINEVEKKNKGFASNYVDRALMKWSWWQEQIQQQCRSRTKRNNNENNLNTKSNNNQSVEAMSLCTEDGQPQWEEGKENCYERDFGCGFPCIDRVVAAEEKKEDSIGR